MAKYFYTYVGNILIICKVMLKTDVLELRIMVELITAPMIF